MFDEQVQQPTAQKMQHQEKVTDDQETIYHQLNEKRFQGMFDVSMHGPTSLLPARPGTIRHLPQQGTDAGIAQWYPCSWCIGARLLCRFTGGFFGATEYKRRT